MRGFGRKSIRVSFSRLREKAVPRRGSDEGYQALETTNHFLQSFFARMRV
jgi:hypothetical protein